MNSTNGKIGNITLESFVGFCDMVESQLGDLIIESGHDAHFQWYAIISGEVNQLFIDAVQTYDSFLGDMNSNMELSIIPRDNGTYSLLIWVNDNARNN